jgi:hypothetical protein
MPTTKYKKGAFRGKRISFRQPGEAMPLLLIDADSIEPAEKRIEIYKQDILNRIEAAKPIKVVNAASPTAKKFESQINILSKLTRTWDMPKPEEVRTTIWEFPKAKLCPYPETTNLVCWWDLHPLPKDSSPFPLPYGYNPEKKTFYVIGVFCGPSCAKAYALNTGYGSYEKISSWISLIAPYYGYDPHITVAPPRELLDMFSGECGMTIDKFREYCQCGCQVRIMQPIFTTQEQCIIAEANNLKKKQRSGHIVHLMCPDDIENKLTVKRRIYPGKNARMMSDFIK